MQYRIIFFTAAFLAVALPAAFFSSTADNFLIKSFIFATAVTGCVVYSVNKQLRWGKVGKLILVFIAFKAVSLLWTPNKSVGFDVFFRQAIIIAGGYFLGVNILSKYKKSVLKFTVYGSVIPVIYGFLQLTGNDPIRWRSTFSGRIGSLLGNPNFFSGYIIAVIPVAVYFIFSNKRVKKIFPLLAVISLVYCLIMTETRSSMIALAAEGIMLLLLIKDRTVRAGVVVLTVAGFILIFTGSSLRERFIHGITLTSSSVTQRIFKWKTAGAMIKNSPLIGQGTGGVKTNYALYQAPVMEKYPLQLKGTSESQIHSEYLQVFAETGVIGLGIFLMVLFYGLRNFIKHQGEESLFLLIAVLGVAADSIASFPLYIVPTGFLFYMYLGLADTEIRTTSIRPATARVFSAILFLIYFKLSLVSFYADHLRWKADAVTSRLPVKAHEYYLKAHKLSPVDGQAEYRHARLMYEMGRLDEAEKALKNSIRIRHYGEVYNDLGIVYYLKKEYHKALVIWEKALTIGLPNPDDLEILKNNVKKLKKQLEKGGSGF